jgi:predicted lipoprotein with Yx(FWY)xxD motif
MFCLDLTFSVGAYRSLNRIHHVIKRQLLPIAATLALSMLPACGGGSGSTGTSLTPAAPAPTAAPVSTPTPAPAPTTASTAVVPLVTAELKGSPGFVNKNSHTVYVFDADLAAPGTSTCSGACAAVWPAIVVPATAALPAPFALIKRTDGTFQLAYSGRPLYSYIADTAAGSTIGDGLTEFGGVWHIARPTGNVAPTPAPGTSNPPGSIY